VIPLRLIAIGDFARSHSCQGLVLKRIDKESFNEVLCIVCPELTLQIRDPGAPDLSPVLVDIPLTELKSFHPASLLSNLESLRGLKEARQAILDFRDRRIDRERFMDLVKATPLLRLSGPDLTPSRESPTTTPAPARKGPTREDSPDAIDSLLDIVDAPSGRPVRAEETTEGAARIQQFISDMFADRDGERALDPRTASAWIVQVEGLLSKQVGGILANPEFRQKERAWRGLKFLVDRTDFREPILLELLPADKEHLTQVLEGLVGEADVAGTPVTAIITDFEFDATASDMELLRHAAGLAEQLQAPLLVNLGSRFFGRDRGADTSAISHLPTHLEAPEYVKWRGLREAESSRWLGACYNRLLLRNGYGGSSGRKLGFAFREADEELWGNPSWAVGSLLTRCSTKTNWCGHITGLRGGGLIENLQLQNYTLSSGTEIQIPLETIFLKDREYDFFEAGILALQCGENQDMAVLLQAPSVHHPEKYSEARETEVSRWRASLIYQLVAARFVRHLETIIARLDPARTPEEMQQSITAGLTDLLGDAVGSGAGVSARLSASQERTTGFFDLQLHIRPGPSIWSLPVDIDLSIPVRRHGCLTRDSIGRKIGD